MANLVPAAGSGAPYQIQNSLIFTYNSSSLLHWTPAGSGTDTNVWTFSCWFKGNMDNPDSGQNRAIFSACNTGGTPTQNYNSLYFSGISNSDSMRVFGKTSNVDKIYAVSEHEFRDPTGWHHVLLVVNTDEAVLADRTKMYIDGTEVTYKAKSATYPSLSEDVMFINKAYLHQIGAMSNVSGNSFFDGKLADVIFIDGQALTPSDFGEFHPTSPSVWRPINPGSLDFSGTNSFWLNFADGTSTTTLGYDVSGNDNHWSLTNIGTDHQSEDTPTNNYLTLNASYNVQATVKDDGGRVITGSSSQLYNWIGNHCIPSKGKWYWEVELTNANANQVKLGIYRTDGSGAFSYYYTFDGIVYNNGGNEAAAATGAINDVWGIAVDSDANTVSYYQNNVLQKTTSLCLYPLYCVPFVGAGAAVTTFRMRTEDGEFTYTPPANHHSLCAKNIELYGQNTQILEGTEYFESIPYTGDGAASKTISNTQGFDVGLTWFKRSDSTYGWRTADSTRGATAQLALETAATETVSTTEILSFPSGGVEIGSNAGINSNTTPYVSMQWKDDTAIGIDIVTYTGNGANRTISHSLGSAPGMIVVKKRQNDTENWAVYHWGMGNTKLLSLDTNSAAGTSATYWNSTSPTSTVFSVGTSALVNDNTDTYVAWLFGDSEGASKTFSYTGNGSADGLHTYLGFKPAFILIKRWDTTGNWSVWTNGHDPDNMIGTYQVTNGTLADQTLQAMDFSHSGFKIRTTNALINASGGTYIGVAFAEIPFTLLNNGEYK